MSAKSTIKFCVNAIQFEVDSDIYNEHFVMADRSAASDVFQDVNDYIIETTDTKEHLETDIYAILGALRYSSIDHFTGAERSIQSMPSDVAINTRLANPDIVIQFVDKYLKEPKKLIRVIVPEVSCILWHLRYYHELHEDEGVVYDILNESLGNLINKQTFYEKRLANINPFSTPPFIWYTVFNVNYYCPLSDYSEDGADINSDSDCEEFLSYACGEKTYTRNEIKQHLLKNRKTICMALLYIKETKGYLTFRNGNLEAFMKYALDIDEFYDDYDTYINAVTIKPHSGRPDFYPLPEELAQKIEECRVYLAAKNKRSSHAIEEKMICEFDYSEGSYDSEDIDDELNR